MSEPSTPAQKQQAAAAFGQPPAGFRRRLHNILAPCGARMSRLRVGRP